MSSWIPSLFNPFTDDDNPTPSESASPPKSPSAGAREDLSAVFRGVAAFLAPTAAASSSEPASPSEAIEGIKSDLAEIQGTFRSGLSLISSRITSNLLQLQNQLNEGLGNDVEEEGDEMKDEDDEDEDEDEDEDGWGISEEILDFVMKISRRPELWTDFPLSLPDEFHLSDYQREHAANIDHLVPDFVTLREKVCSQMSNGKFWLIYFILLLPRLNEEDLNLLSTPQVTEARETLLKKLQNKTDQGTSGNPESTEAKDAPAETINPTQQKQIVDETEITHHSEAAVHIRLPIDTQEQPQNEEDVSFSDLEEDEDDPSDKVSTRRVSTSDKTWVELDENTGSQGTKQTAEDHNVSKDKGSEGEDSNDWLTVDDTDFDNLGAV